MLYRFLADAVVLIHLGFVVFVVAGGFLVLRWPRAAWIQLPGVAALAANLIAYALVLARSTRSRDS